MEFVTNINQGRIIMSKEPIKMTDLYDGYQKASVKDAYLRKYIEIRTYVPFSVKAINANNIIKNSCVNKEGEIWIDSVKRFYLTAQSIIALYTNIECDPKRWLNDYDLLVSSGIYNSILSNIPAEEREAYENIIGMAYDDLITNCTLRTQGAEGNALLKMFSGLLSSLMDVAENSGRVSADAASAADVLQGKVIQMPAKIDRESDQ